MTARHQTRTSKLARWSRRVALFAGQLLLVGILMHHFGTLSTTSALYILALALVLAGIALLLSVSSLISIWQRGLEGAGYASAGAVFALAIIAGPLLFVPSLLALPKINDIATSPEAPPAFGVLAGLRPRDANPPEYPGDQYAALQERAYPNIRPMTLERSVAETHVLVRDAVERLGWRIVSETKPTASNPGRVEAVAKTLIMGFADDVVIRISAIAGESLVDVRSASRYGYHDFGTNARRINRFFAEVKAGLEKGERTALEIALARRARETRKLEKKARDKAIKEVRLRAKEEEKRQRTLLEEERKRQEAELRTMYDEQLRIQSQSPEGRPPGFFPFPRATQDAPKPRVRRRGRRWNQPADRFFQRFGE
ncbi:MAG: DUF1499 domain-containing protein [Hyphomicrobiales bacterium]|nr:DUF1499 domain-containing protein [Hyphomicrobiales bacterium]